MTAAPRSEHELLARAEALSGLSVAALARRLKRDTPRDLRRAKGWVGELIEQTLGAASGSLPLPDFPEFAIELKTIPVKQDGRPKESTHVCTVPLVNNAGLSWEHSLVKHKLTRVLWVPVQGENRIPLGARRIGSPLLWSPTPAQEQVLWQDWEELMEMVSLGRFDQLTAYHGKYLQIRPKAANGAALTQGVDDTGQPILTLPRGFYLRTSFTEEILKHYFAGARWT